MNVIDRFISFFAPKFALERVKARAKIDIYRSYEGASSTKKSLKYWNVSARSVDRDDLPDIPSLRARSRDLYRNDPIVVGAIETNLNSVVGAGLRVQSHIDADYLGLSEEKANEWEISAERTFGVWASSVNADAARQKNFYELQGVALASALLSGDVFALLPGIERDFWPYRTSVALIEADRVCNENDVPDTQKLAGGIMVDSYGAPVEYHILKFHPGGYELNREWVKVPAFGKSGRRNVVHLFRQVRPGQRRGVPYLAPVLKHLKLLGDYTEAELTAALITGLFTVFIKNENPDEQIFDSNGNIELGPGAVVGLNAMEDIAIADPKRPNGAYEAFVRGILEQIGTGLGIPYEVLIKHFTSSYTASRAAFLEAWRAFKSRRSWFVSGFCQPIYEAVITEAVVEGRLDAPGFLEDPFIRAAYLKTSWTGPAAGQINERVETEAAQKRVENGFSTRAKEAAEINGTDFDQNVRRARREIDLMHKSGLLKEKR